jgi:hypothetical protein
VVEGFSHSQDVVEDNFAYGDHGQNYKNLVQLVHDLPSLKGAVQTTVFGCPEPSR